MTDDSKDMFAVLLGAAMFATVILVIVGALYNTGQTNAEKDQRFKLACIQSGGSFVSGSCVNPAAAK